MTGNQPVAADHHILLEAEEFDDFGGWVKRKLVSPEREREIAEEQERSGMAPEPAWGD